MGRKTLTVVAIATILAFAASIAGAQTYQDSLNITATDAVSGERVSLDTSETGRAEDAGLALSVSQPDAAGPARVVSIDLRDTTGTDRAVDLDVTLSAELTGWQWYRNIREATPVAPLSRFLEDQYPLAAVTPEDGGEGKSVGIFDFDE